MSNVSNKKIGQKIKILRENANLTQKQLAAYLFVDQGLVSKLEKGVHSINLSVLDKTSSLFFCPTESFISNNDIILTDKKAFKAGSMKTEDLCALSIVNKIALNQLEMDKLSGGIVNDQNVESKRLDN